MKDFFGLGSVKKIKGILESCNTQKVFLVTGKESYASSGAKDSIEPLLNNFAVTHFFDFETNPKLHDVTKGVSLLKDSNPDIVLAIGGGSVIDMAKLVNIFSFQEGDMKDYILSDKSILNKGKPLVAVPTTAGSGSETTHFAVLYSDKVKYSIANPHILPDYCIVDPELTMRLPKNITASTGLDALAQAIESYWCVNSNVFSKSYAKKAMNLVFCNIKDAVNNPSVKSRIAMSKGAHLAGKAINITKTTAPHAVSYALTSHFGISHGHAVGLTLGKMLIYNSKVNNIDLSDKRGVDYVKKVIGEICEVLGVKDAYSADKILTEFIESIGLKTKLKDLKIKYQDLDLIISKVNLERVRNNPRLLKKDKLKTMLKSIYG